MKKNDKQKAIILVAPTTRTRNLIINITEKGMYPIVITPNYKDKETIATAPEYVWKTMEFFLKNDYKKYKWALLKDDQSLSQNLLRYEKEYEIVGVIGCSDPSIKLADKLQKKYGFPSNPELWVKNRANKFWVNQQIEKAGLRAIKTMRVSRTTNLGGVIKYFNNTFPLFIKPISGAGSMDAYKIENVKELQTKLESLFKIKQDGSLKYETFLVQEYIEGEQYIINFYTYKGTPYFTDAWIYKREITEKNGVVFRNVVFINKITPRVQEMIEYCSKTIMACNHQLGAVHAEIVFDSKDNGPILIEHNWRQMGATMFMDAPVIDGKYSNNEFLLQATINPNKVLKELEIVDYTNTKFFAPILIHRGPETKLLKFHDFVYRNLRSFSRFLPITLENTKIRYTNNFDDSLAAIDLIHDDYEVISKDQELIWEINENYDEVLYETTDNLWKLKKHKVINKTNIKELTKYVTVSSVWSENPAVIKEVSNKISSSEQIDNDHLPLLIDTDKIPSDFKKAFELVESIGKKIKKGGLVILSDYAIKSNIRCLKTLFALNNFDIQIHNEEQLLNDYVFLVKM